MSIIRRMGRLTALSSILLLAMITGLFLMTGGRLKALSGAPSPGTATATRPAPSRPETAPATATTRAAATTQTAPATGRGIDIPETQQGQPVPRNMLE